MSVDLPTLNKYKYNTQYNTIQTATRTNTTPAQAGKGFRMTYFKVFANAGKTDTYQWITQFERHHAGRKLSQSTHRHQQVCFWPKAKNKLAGVCECFVRITQCWQTYVLANKDALKRILHNFEFLPTCYKDTPILGDFEFSPTLEINRYYVILSFYQHYVI